MVPAPTVTERNFLALDQPIPVQTGERWRTGMSVLPDIVIEREIGWGGMGVVYLVTQRITGKPLALKRVSPAQFSSNDRAQRLLYRELITWLNLPQHPHVVPCLFFRTLESGELVLFSPYIGGGTVSSWIDDGRAKSLQVALNIGTQTASGLSFVHSRGITLLIDTASPNTNWVTSNVTIPQGVSYELIAWGLADIAENPTRQTDAEYFQSTAGPWVDFSIVSGVTFDQGIRVRNVGSSTNDVVSDWGSFQSSHVYTKTNLVGSGTQLKAQFYSSNPGDNEGSLYLQIRRDAEVTGNIDLTFPSVNDGEEATIGGSVIVGQIVELTVDGLAKDGANGDFRVRYDSSHLTL